MALEDGSLTETFFTARRKRPSSKSARDPPVRTGNGAAEVLKSLHLQSMSVSSQDTLPVKI